MAEACEGILCDIGYADGITPVLAVPERPVPNGHGLVDSFLVAPRIRELRNKRDVRFEVTEQRSIEAP
jgi:hypothetical protein